MSMKTNVVTEKRLREMLSILLAESGKFGGVEQMLRQYCLDITASHITLQKDKDMVIKSLTEGLIIQQDFTLEAQQYTALEEWIAMCPSREMFEEAMAIAAGRSIDIKHKGILKKLVV